MEKRLGDHLIYNSMPLGSDEMMNLMLMKPTLRGKAKALKFGDTGEVLTAMMEAGAVTDCLDTAVWTLTSMTTDGVFPEAAITNGTVHPFMHDFDNSLPHSMLVDQEWRRICNESAYYLELGEKLYQRHEEAGRGIAARVIFDTRYRSRNSWGTQPPRSTPKDWIGSGYMKMADRLQELAELCGIDAQGLEREVAEFYGFASSGKDEDVNRGGRAFDRSHSDPTVKPNPSLGAIANGPFYATVIFDGHVGTSGGVLSDLFAWVKRDDGSVIPGLHAAENAVASPIGRTYPEQATSIGNAFKFG